VIKEKYEVRRQQSLEKTKDIFSDFFGFGPTPPGCENNGNGPNIPKEKENFLALLDEEVKTYNIASMNQDLSNK